MQAVKGVRGIFKTQTFQPLLGNPIACAILFNFTQLIELIDQSWMFNLVQPF